MSALKAAPPETRKPFNVYCDACGHAWAAAYLPMEMKKCAQLLSRLNCPMCAANSKRIFLGNASRMTTAIRIMSLPIDITSDTGRRSTWLGRFWWRLRNNTPVLFLLARTTWEEL